MIDSAKINAFRNSETHREALRSFIESDIGKLILDLLRKAGIKNDEPKVSTLVPWETLCAHQFQYQRGISETLDAIERMTRIPTQAEEEKQPYMDGVKAMQDEFQKAKTTFAEIQSRQKAK